jgi:hypothetical protein
MILKALNEACNYIDGILGVDEPNITKEFETNCISIIEKLSTKTFVIETTIVQQAKALVDYFLMNKLVLASYSVDPTNDFEAVVTEIFNNHEQKPQFSGRFLKEQTKTIHLMQKILFFKKNHQPTANMIANGNDCVGDVVSAIAKLVECGIGTSHTEKANNNRTVTTYKPASHHEFTNNPLLGQIIQELGCNLKKYTEHLASMEYSISERLKNKRKRDDYIEVEDDYLQQPKKHKSDSTEAIVRINKKNKCTYLVKSSTQVALPSLKQRPVTKNYSQILNSDECAESESDEASQCDLQSDYENDALHNRSDSVHLTQPSDHDEHDDESEDGTDHDVLFNNSTIQSKLLTKKKPKKLNTRELKLQNELPESQSHISQTSQSRKNKKKIEDNNKTIPIDSLDKAKKLKNITTSFDDEGTERKIISNRMLGETNLKPTRSSPRLANITAKNNISLMSKSNKKKKLEKLNQGDI